MSYAGPSVSSSIAWRASRSLSGAIALWKTGTLAGSRVVHRLGELVEDRLRVLVVSGEDLARDLEQLERARIREGAAEPLRAAAEHRRRRRDVTAERSH